MAKTEMKEYRVTLQNGEENTTVCIDAAQAVADFDSVDNPVTMVQRIRTAIFVNVPDETLLVDFQTLIVGSGAEDAGCKATPSTFTVADGSTVIFEATPADGYNFVGWFIGEDTTGTPESTEQIASIAIDSTLGVSKDFKVSALFAPVA